MAVGALLSGLTNVVTIAACAGNKYMKWTDLGISLGTNAIGHGGGENGKTSDELLIEIRKFHVERIAALAKKLDAVKEGHGTVLDNTLIVYMSDFGDQPSPVLRAVAGGAHRQSGRQAEDERSFPRVSVIRQSRVIARLARFTRRCLHAVGDKRENLRQR